MRLKSQKAEEQKGSRAKMFASAKGLKGLEPGADTASVDSSADSIADSI